MIDYTSEQPKDFILTCLIMVSGLIDYFICYMINYLTEILQLNFFPNFITFLLMLFASYKIVYKLFDECFWKKKAMLNYFNVYNLNGKWEGYTETKKYGKKDFSATIEQTWTKIDMKLETNQSKSHLISFSFNKSKSMHDIFYTYSSEVNQDQEEIKTHYGTCMLDIDEDKDMLKGSYFTNGQRKTYGDICLKRIK